MDWILELSFICHLFYHLCGLLSNRNRQQLPSYIAFYLTGSSNTSGFRDPDDADIGKEGAVASPSSDGEILGGIGGEVIRGERFY